MEVSSTAPGDRAAAIEQLGNLQTKNALALIVDHRLDRSPEVRMRAVEALAKFAKASATYFREALAARGERG
jgi:HEAT repeat protein